MFTLRFVWTLAAASALVSVAEAQTTTGPSRWGAGDELGMAQYTRLRYLAALRAVPRKPPGQFV